MPILEQFIEFVQFVFRPLMAAVVMATSSYVLGTVVGYQYHLTLLGFKPETDQELETAYRLIARKFYEGGFVIGLAIATVIDSRTSSPLYYLVLGAVVFLCWLAWLRIAYSRMRDRIRQQGVTWEWVVSSLSLAFASSFVGATAVSQWFQWMGWRPDVLKW